MDLVVVRPERRAEQDDRRADEPERAEDGEREDEVRTTTACRAAAVRSS